MRSGPSPQTHEAQHSKTQEREERNGGKKKKKEREKARTLSSPSHTRLLLTPSAASPCSALAPAHSSPFPIALAVATPFANAITPDPVPEPLTRALRLCAARFAGTNGDPPFPFATLCESADPDPIPD